MESNDLERAFDHAGKTILEMSQEIEELQQKFGERSRLVETKSAQLATLINLHEKAQSAINLYRRAMHLAMINQKVLEVAVMKHETGLPWEKVAKVVGFDPDEGRSMDVIDYKLKSYWEQLKELYERKEK